MVAGDAQRQHGLSERLVCGCVYGGQAAALNELAAYCFTCFCTVEVSFCKSHASYCRRCTVSTDDHVKAGRQQWLGLGGSIAPVHRSQGAQLSHGHATPDS